MEAQSALDWLTLLGLGLVAGAIGQVARAIVGLKKLADKEGTDDMFSRLSTKRLVFSMVLGAAAGCLAAGVSGMRSSGVTPEQLAALFAAGYAGSDFIEGFISRAAPKSV